MYGCNRKVLIVLIAYLIGTVFFQIAMLNVIVFASSRALLHYSTLIFLLKKTLVLVNNIGCFGINTLSYAYAYWIPVAIFETVLFLLALCKIVEYARRKEEAPNLMVILFRDSLLFFVAILMVSVLNCVMWKFGSVGFRTSLDANSY